MPKWLNYINIKYMALKNKHSDLDIDYGVIYTKRDFSPRYYTKLSDNDQLLLDKSLLMPKVALFALKIHHEYQEQVSLALAIAIAKNHWPLYQEWVTQNALLFNKRPLPLSLVTREFEFQGFKPVRADKRKPFTLELERCIESLGFNLKYAFITSNQILEGYIWIYPEEFANDYSDLLNGKRYIANIFNNIGVSEFTKLKTNI